MMNYKYDTSSNNLRSHDKCEPDPVHSDACDAKPQEEVFQNKYSRAEHDSTENSRCDVDMLDCRYGRICIFANDLPIARSLSYYGEWGQAELDLLERLIEPGQTVLDIGAHVGTRTLAFASAVGPRGDVYAFEPQSALFQLLLGNVKSNACDNVYLYHAAISDEEGRAQLETVDYSKPANLGAVRCMPDTGQDSGESVSTITVDSLALKSCALIKADVEGMEANVIAGSIQTIQKHRPLIYLEVNSISSGWAIIEKIREFGYRTWLHGTPAFNPDNYRGEAKNIFGKAHESSLLAVPNERFEKFESVIHGSPGLVDIGDLDNWARAFLSVPRYGDPDRLEGPVAVLARRKNELELELASEKLEVARVRSEISDLQEQLNQQKINNHEITRKIYSVYKSKSWRWTKPLRVANRYVTEAVAQFLSRSRDSTHSRVFEIISSDGQAALHVESAVVRGRRLEVRGWVTHEAASPRHVFLLVGDRKVPLHTGIERPDVYDAFGYASALYSGFSGTTILESPTPNTIEINCQFVGYPPARAKVFPRFEGRPLRQSVVNVWQAANWRRLMTAVRLLAHGDWRFAWDRLIRRVDAAEGAPENPALPPGLEEALSSINIKPVHLPKLQTEIDIVVPVYNGLRYLEPLFDSIQKNTSSGYRLIIVDDNSSDPDVWPFLQELARNHPKTVLLRNEVNEGFVRAANRGAAHAAGDFVLLNTDVEVPPGWIERLMAPIHQDRTVASTTPFSNAATICSFPEINTDNEPLGNLPVDRIDRWFARVRPDYEEIVLPSGIGFCMGINGDAWRHVGGFDEEVFGRGYGEENDWCCRAYNSGYRSILVPNLFVLHKHGGSFENAERTALRERNLSRVVSRHPEYPARVRSFNQDDPPHVLRKLLTMLVIGNESTAPPVLIIDHDMGGGANRYREALVDERLRADQPVLLLTAIRGPSPFPEAMRLRMSWRQYSAIFDLESLSPLEELFSEHMPLGEIFYNNAVSYRRPLALVDSLYRVKLATGAKSVVAIHDFYPLCPSYKLLDTHGVYQPHQDEDTWREALYENPYAKNPEGADIGTWRRTWCKLMRASEKILCFSEDSRMHVEAAYPETRGVIEVRPHKLLSTFSSGVLVPRQGPLHVGVVGAIDYAKGAHVVAALARHLADVDPEARLTVIGILNNAPALPNLTVTGRYRPGDLPSLLEQHGINVCFLPSVWPETFSYVAEEIMALKMPFACFDIGAPSERVRHYSRGQIIPFRYVSSPEKIHDYLARIQPKSCAYLSDTVESGEGPEEASFH